MTKTFTLLVLSLFIFACTQDKLDNPLDTNLNRTLKKLSPDGELSYYILPDSDNLDAIPQGVGNALTHEKVALGKMLFFETGLALDAMHESGKGTYSCATCHIPSAGFMPGRVQGIADGGVGFGFNGEDRDRGEYLEEELDVQGARPLSMLNVTYVTNSTWSGKFGANGVNVDTEYAWLDEEVTAVNFLGLDGLEAQNIEGLELHRMVVNQEVLDSLGYIEMYDEAFGEFPVEERYSPLTTSFALSAYIRTLLTTEAPFQKWLKGDREAMTDQEKLGAQLFFSKAGCFRCHKGPALNAMEFHALGVRDLHENPNVYQTSIDDKRNLGRGGFTKREEDMYKFKVPQLYNMGDSPFYFHGSSKRSLLAVVEYFNQGIPENVNVPEDKVSPLLHPLYLSAEEVDALVAFLDNGLRDPDLERYVPEVILSGNCFPNNDPVSQNDLGCN